MTTIQAAAASQSVPASALATKDKSAVLSSDFETFLKMLTVQLKNQDPLNPVDSADYAVQLATFSSVEQQVLTNDLLKSLASQMGVAGMAQMSSWVGMEGLSPAARAFDGSTPIPLSVTPERTANRADLIVRDSSGREVQRHALDPSADNVQWTGRDDFGLSAMPGLYTFSVESFLDETSLAETPVQSYSRLVEARLENGDTVLVTEEGAEISADLISGIRKPAL